MGDVELGLDTFIVSGPVVHDEPFKVGFFLGVKEGFEVC